jgi:hypothetical protein
MEDLRLYEAVLGWAAFKKLALRGLASQLNIVSLTLLMLDLLEFLLNGLVISISEPRPGFHLADRPILL